MGSPTSISSIYPPVWAEKWDSLVAEPAQSKQIRGHERSNVVFLAQQLDQILNTGNAFGPPIYLRVARENGRVAVNRLPPPERMSMIIR